MLSAKEKVTKLAKTASERAQRALNIFPNIPLYSLREISHIHPIRKYLSAGALLHTVKYFSLHF
jgi:hypothetical protein